MIYNASKAPRTFILFLEPSVADPAFNIACAELLGDGEVVRMGDYSVIKELIAEAERR